MTATFTEETKEKRLGDQSIFYIYICLDSIDEMELFDEIMQMASKADERKAALQRQEQLRRDADERKREEHIQLMAAGKAPKRESIDKRIKLPPAPVPPKPVRKAPSFEELMKAAEEKTAAAALPRTQRNQSSSGSSGELAAADRKRSRRDWEEEDLSPAQRTPTAVVKADSNKARLKSTLDGLQQRPVSIPSMAVSKPRPVSRPKSAPKNTLASLQKQMAKRPIGNPNSVKASIDIQSLTRLNTKKRDLRTIEEIQMDLKKRREERQRLEGGSASSSSETEAPPPPRRPSKPAAPNGNLNAMPKGASHPRQGGKTIPASSFPNRSPATAPVPKRNGSVQSSASSTDRRDGNSLANVDWSDESYVRNNYSDIIRGMFGTKDKYVDVDGDDDVDNMEASIDQIEREERQSARMAKAEDRREAALEQQRQQRTLERKLKKMKRQK